MSGSPAGAATADAPSGRFRRWWRNRPVRPQRGGKVSGVSAAIGLRYGIDPILIRIAFVVATIYGSAGIPLYLLCWLVFPKADGHGGSQPTPGPVAAVLVLLLIPSVYLVSPKYGAAGLALGIGGFYLLHRSYHDRAAVRLASAPPVGENAWAAAGAPGTWDSDPATQHAESAEHSESGPSVATEPGPGQRHRWISYAAVGLAMIAAGAAVFHGAETTTVLAVALGVLGAGMVVASFAGGGRGLLGLAIPLAALALVANALPVGGTWPTSGHLVVHPDHPAAVLPRYELSKGNITLDLRSLRLGDDQRVHSSVRVGEGSVLIHVPDDANLAASCSADQGSVRCGGEGLDQRIEDSGKDGGRITLDLDVRTGSVEVIRG